MTTSADLVLGVDARKSEAGYKQYVAGLNAIRTALEGIERAADGAFPSLRKSMQAQPENNAVRPINQTAEAVKRLQATAKNYLTSAGTDIAKVVKQFHQLGDTDGIDRAEQAMARLHRRMASAKTAGDQRLVQADHKETVVGLKAEAAAQKEAASAAARHERETEGLLKRHYEMFAASKRHEKSLLEIAELESRGAITAERAAEARARATRQLEAGAVATGKYGQALKVSQFHVTNFSHQIQDMIVGSQFQSFGTVMLQQGMQLSSIFTTLGSKAKILASVKGAFLSLLNPMTLIQPLFHRTPKRFRFWP